MGFIGLSCPLKHQNNIRFLSLRLTTLKIVRNAAILVHSCMVMYILKMARLSVHSFFCAKEPAYQKTPLVQLSCEA